MPRFVVGVDGSPGSAAALQWAVEHAGGDPIRVVAAWHIPLFYVPTAAAVVTPDDFEQWARARAEEMVGAVDYDGAITIEVTRGRSGEVLVAAAEDADALVVGTRGLGGVGSIFLGSVSHWCASHATCPVVIVPAPEDEPVE